MKPEQMARVVEGLATIADKIRALNAADVPRAEIARFLNRRYQHVRNVLEQDEIKAAAAILDQRAQFVTSGQHSETKIEASNELSHCFMLRPEWPVTLRLPGNLTAKEAERLSAFVMSLPF